MTVPAIACLKITLDEVKPAVMRRVEVPLTLTLDRLHRVIQTAMGWTNSHLYEFRAGRAFWLEPDPDEPYVAATDPKKARLADVLQGAGAKSLKYIYDFGDDWGHTIKVERLVDPEPDALYPRLIEVQGPCPPEDCGGPLAYAEFREALADRRHERHKDMVEWIGKDFDPAFVHPGILTAEVEALAKRWAKRPG